MKNSKLIKILSIALAVLLAFSAAFVLFSCKKVSGDDPPPEETDEQLGTWEYTRDPSLEDFATKVTLSSLEGIDSDFDKTGFGRVTVEQHIDGDTVHFWNNSKTEIIKARFIAIDTPESTGKIEPWGKPASIFTKTTLKHAAEIVLQSDVDGTVPLDKLR